MKMSQPFDKLKARTQKLPENPGVYLFKKGRTILYIGKATSLRDRVRSYFSGDIHVSRGPVIEKMLAEATDIDFEETDSVLEALILESALIKKHQPLYNSKEKSDTSFNHVVITKEEYPRVFAVRGKALVEEWDPSDLKYSFGPFTQSSELREALKIIRKIFPFRGEKDPVEREKKGKSYLNREIGLVPDLEQIGKREYARTIRNLKLFFEGKKGKLIKQLEKEMKEHAKKEAFEKADEVKRQIFALNHIRDTSLIKPTTYNLQPATSLRIEGYDVAHISGTDTVGVMVVVEGGIPQKGKYRKFKIKSKKLKGDTGALEEVLKRRFKHDEWALPKLIVVDGSTAQINTAKKVLEQFGYQITIVAVVKGKGHAPKRIDGARKHVRAYERDILLANSEAHRFAIAYHRKKRSQM